MNGTITLSADDYSKLISDATDGKRLKDFLWEACKHYRTLSYAEIVLICNVYGIEDGGDE